MQTIILCGGLGTRLREETDYRPKPMVNIGDRPILWHIMKIYASYGYNEFVLALGYKGYVIKEYFYHYQMLNNSFTIDMGQENRITFHGNQSVENWRITLMDTGEYALKGARIKRLEKFIEGDTFMVTYGDGVANIDIRELVKFHHAHGKIGTVSGVRPPSRFGALQIEGEKVHIFAEKPQTTEGFINGGFFVLNREIFDRLTDDDNCDFEHGPLEQLAEEGELMVYKHVGQWECMDNYRDLTHLNKLYAENKAFWKNWE